MTFPIEVFDPPLCCATGVCGTDIDAELVRFAADLEWLAKQGIDVQRFNLAQQPGRFAEDPVVARELKARGNDCLPLILAAGTVVDRGRYPTRAQLAQYAELDAQLTKDGTDTLSRTDNLGTEALVKTDSEKKESSCCGGEAKAEPEPEPAKESSCCGGEAKPASGKSCC